MESMNSQKNGSPMTSTMSPIDSESPVTAQVKYTIPVTREMSRKSSEA